jgi:hypothetical protein
MNNFFKRNPKPPEDGPEIKSPFPPLGWFRIVLPSGKKLLAHNSLAFGVMIGVKNTFSTGGQTFTRDLLAPLPIWKKPAPQPAGLTVRGDCAFRDTTTLEGFDGNFQYEPLR